MMQSPLQKYADRENWTAFRMTEKYENWEAGMT